MKAELMWEHQVGSRAPGLCEVLLPRGYQGDSEKWWWPGTPGLTHLP